MPTIVDVAQQAGVSVSTAARVLSGRGYAARDTRARVQQAAKDIGYVPNHVARSLRLQQTQMIGLLVADVENTFYSQIAKSVESVTKRSGYHVILCNTNEDAAEEKQTLDLLASLRVDGIILTPTGRNRRKLDELRRSGVAIVQMDRTVDRLQTDAVHVDDAEGAAMAVDHLVAAGHTRIGMLAGPLDVTTGRKRQEGYESALERHGIAPEPRLIRHASFRADHAVEHALALLAEEPRPTAVFAANNVLASALMIAAARTGLAIPGDLSVVAFDDVPWMSILTPQVTTVRQPVAEMAQTAAGLLLRRIAGETDEPPSTVTFAPALVVRDTVATPPV